MWYAACALCIVTQSCLTLCNPVKCRPSGSSIHGILQARILEWVATSFSRGSFRANGWTHISCISFIGRWVLDPWATWKPVVNGTVASQVALVVKSLPASAVDMRRGFSPWVGKIPWERKRQPVSIFLPGDSHRQRNLAGPSPHGGTDSEMIEAT